MQVLEDIRTARLADFKTELKMIKIVRRI